MERREALVVAVVALAGAVGLLALTVYPFEYGLVESAALVGALVALALVETVLGEAEF